MEALVKMKQMAIDASVMLLLKENIVQMRKVGSRGLQDSKINELRHACAIQIGETWVWALPLKDKKYRVS